MKAILRRLSQRPSLRNVAVLASGTAAAQAITVAISPVLTRLYSPAEFGIFGVFMAVAAIIVTIAALNYELAIIIAHDDDEANDVTALCLLILVGTTLISWIVLLLIGDWLAAKLGSPAATAFLQLVPLFVLIGGLVNVGYAWANRAKFYGSISIGAMWRSIGAASFQVLSGLLGAGPLGLIIGHTFGSAVQQTALLWTLRRQRIGLIRRMLNFDNLRRVARSHSRFPKYNVPVMLLITVSKHFPSMFLAGFFSPAAAGLYWFTMRLLEMPSNLIGEAVRRVCYQRSAELHRGGGDVVAFWQKVTIGMLALASVPAAVIILFAPALFALFFGAEWREAGHYAQWLVIWWAASFTRIPSSALSPVYGLQRSILVIESFAFVCRAGAILLAAIVGEAMTAIVLYSIVGLVRDLVEIVYVRIKISPRHSTAPGT